MVVKSTMVFMCNGVHPNSGSVRGAANSCLEIRWTDVFWPYFQTFHFCKCWFVGKIKEYPNPLIVLKWLRAVHWKDDEGLAGGGIVNGCLSLKDRCRQSGSVFRWGVVTADLGLLS